MAGQVPCLLLGRGTTGSRRHVGNSTATATDVKPKTCQKLSFVCLR